MITSSDTSTLSGSSKGRFVRAGVIGCLVASIVAAPVVWAAFDGVVDTPTLREGIGATIGLGALLPFLGKGRGQGQVPRVVSQTAVPVALALTLAALFVIHLVLRAVAGSHPSSIVVVVFILASISVVVLMGACFGLIFGMGSRDGT